MTTPTSASGPKPGIQTTEFWSTMLVHLLTVLTVLYTTVLHRNFDSQGTLNALIPSLSIVASGIAQAFYSHSRAGVKRAFENGYSVIPSITGTLEGGGAAKIVHDFNDLHQALQDTGLGDKLRLGADVITQKEKVAQAGVALIDLLLAVAFASVAIIVASSGAVAVGVTLLIAEVVIVSVMAVVSSGQRSHDRALRGEVGRRLDKLSHDDSDFLRRAG